MSALELRVNVRLGNDAMLTAEDLSRVVERVAADLADWSDGQPIEGPTSPVNLRDLNGARVGSWSIEVVA